MCERACSCVFRRCVCGCSAGRCVPGERESVSGCASRRRGRKEVSAGLEARGGSGGFRRSAPAPGATAHPHPHPAARGPFHLPARWVLWGQILSSDALRFNPRDLTVSSLPHNSPFLFSPQPSSIRSVPQPHLDVLPTPALEAWERGRAKADSLPDAPARLDRGLFSGLLGLGVSEGAGGGRRRGDLGDNGSWAALILTPPLRVGDLGDFPGVQR